MEPARPVFVHGAGGGPWVFEEMERRFEGGMVITLPGHGDGRPGLTSVGAYAEWLAGALRSTVGPLVLVGHSLGGAIALQVALDHPDDIAGCVTIASGARLPVPAHARARLREDIAAECTRVMRASLTDPSPEVLARAEDLMAAHGVATLEGDYAACAGVDLRDRLGAMRVPCMVISAGDDTLTPSWLQHELAAALPMPVSITVPHCRHLAMLDQPETVSLCVAAFLARLEAGDAP